MKTARLGCTATSSSSSTSTSTTCDQQARPDPRAATSATARCKRNQQDRSNSLMEAPRSGKRDRACRRPVSVESFLVPGLGFLLSLGQLRIIKRIVLHDPAAEVEPPENVRVLGNSPPGLFLVVGQDRRHDLVGNVGEEAVDVHQHLQRLAPGVLPACRQCLDQPGALFGTQDQVAVELRDQIIDDDLLSTGGSFLQLGLVPALL